jgi:hypothetical protein
MSDVNGSHWIENYADAAQPVYDEGTRRAQAWAIPHIQAGRLPPVSPDAFIAMVSGAPQWIGRMIRIGMAHAPLETVAEEMAAMARRAFAVQ